MIKFPNYIGKYTSSKSSVLGRGKRLELSFSSPGRKYILFPSCTGELKGVIHNCFMQKKKLIDEVGKRRKTLWLNKGLMYLHDNYTLIF